MKRILFIIALIFLLCFYAGNNTFLQYWDHFWDIPPTSSQELGRSCQRQINIHKIQTKEYRNPIYVFEDNQIKYKLQKKVFGGLFGETQFELVLR